MNFIDFYNHHVPALEAEPARHYVLLEALLSVARSPSREFRGWTFGGPGACAIQPMREWAVLLGELTQEHAHALADDLADSDFPSVMGPGQGPDWFAVRAHELGVPMDTPLRNIIHVLNEPPRIPDVAGAVRTVTAGDASLFFAWMRAYVGEALPRDPLPGDAWLERCASEGKYLFWTVDGEPVAVAGIVSEIEAGAAITGVFVPRHLRGRGYGGAVTASAAQRIRDDGGKQVFLMANAGNAPALHCYARIGFQRVEEFTHFWRRYA